jgi:hypothetical protein
LFYQENSALPLSAPHLLAHAPKLQLERQRLPLLLYYLSVVEKRENINKKHYITGA